MRPGLRDTIASNYDTYRNDVSGQQEIHKARLAWQIGISVLLAILVRSFTDNNILAFTTGLAVLVGFAVTAMFPIMTDAIDSLPDPRYSEDYDDVKRIDTLSRYFRSNVSYFIPLALFTIALLALQMLTLRLPDCFVPYYSNFSHLHPKETVLVVYASDAASKAVVASTLFCLAEIIYTFYRMCFNALALLRIREEYRRGRRPASERPQHYD